MRTHGYENDNPFKAALRLFRHNVRDEFRLNSYDSSGFFERLFKGAADLLNTDEDTHVTQKNIMQSYAERVEWELLRLRIDVDDIEGRKQVLESVLKGGHDANDLPINRVTGEPVTADDLDQFMNTDYLGYQRHGQSPAEAREQAIASGELVDGKWTIDNELDHDALTERHKGMTKGEIYEDMVRQWTTQEAN